MRWVRPALTTVFHSSAFFSKAIARWSSAGTRSVMSASVTATWTDVGKTSFDDCDALTWSFGCTSRPSFCVASDDSTSFMFMFDDVPEPVWYVSTGNWSSYSPVTTWSAAHAIASAMSPSSVPSSLLASAAAFLMRASAAMWRDSSPLPEIGKFSTARCVWARYSASAGTRTSPIVSCSIRYSVTSLFLRSFARGVLREPELDVGHGCALRQSIVGAHDAELAAGDGVADHLGRVQDRRDGVAQV